MHIRKLIKFCSICPTVLHQSLFVDDMNFPLISKQPYTPSKGMFKQLYKLHDELILDGVLSELPMKAHSLHILIAMTSHPTYSYISMLYVLFVYINLKTTTWHEIKHLWESSPRHILSKSRVDWWLVSHPVSVPWRRAPSGLHAQMFVTVRQLLLCSRLGGKGGGVAARRRGCHFSASLQ
jgi:hypothetical protein